VVYRGETFLAARHGLEIAAHAVKQDPKRSATTPLESVVWLRHRAGDSRSAEHLHLAMSPIRAVSTELQIAFAGCRGGPIDAVESHNWYTVSLHRADRRRPAAAPILNHNLDKT
jgi:hypothetical protein